MKLVDFDERITWEAEATGIKEIGRGDYESGEMLELTLRADNRPDKRARLLIAWKGTTNKNLITVLQAACISELKNTEDLIGVKFPCRLKHSKPYDHGGGYMTPSKIIVKPVVNFEWLQKQYPPLDVTEEDETCPNCGAILGRDDQ